MIQLKRIYEEPAPQDGTRILVERLWPRGLRKQEARVDLWLKDVAPTPELRQWFGHDPAKWRQFAQRYWKELATRPEAVATLRDQCRRGTVTLVYAARDQEHNGAVALREYLARPARRAAAADRPAKIRR